MRTGEAIGRAVGVAVQPLADAIEFNYGEWEGKTPDEVAAAYPEAYHLWLTQPDLAIIPGGERTTDFRNRIAAVAERIVAAHQGGNVVLVGHRMVGRALACHLLGLDDRCMPRLEVSTGSISIFEKTEEGWTTRLLNGTCHLEETPQP